MNGPIRPDVNKYQTPGLFPTWREFWQIVPILVAACALAWFGLAMVMLVLS